MSPLELVDAAIARIERLDPTLGAVVQRRFERARAEAAGALRDGPFRGVPFLLKDLETSDAGEPCHWGMAALRDAGFVAERTSHIVERYRAAGLVILGRTKTPELGLHITTEPRAYGPCRNPWHPEHSSGGSSGGSAAAVASGMVPAAHATDGGGSIRIPASECGLVGLKPSRGRVSQAPELGASWHGLTAWHVISRSVRDSAALLDVAAGNVPGDPHTAPPPARPFAAQVGADPGRLRIALMQKAPVGAPPCDAACSEAAAAAGRLLESLGHDVEPAHPAPLDEHELLLRGFTQVVASWTARTLDWLGEALGRSMTERDVEPDTWSLACAGAATPAPRYLDVVESLHAWSRRVGGFFAEEGFDLLVTPTLGTPPPRLGALVGDPAEPGSGTARALDLLAFTPQWNVTGQPAISLPLGWSPDGLPLGVQLVAAAYREDLLLRVAAQLETEAPWSGRRPRIHA